MRPFVSEAAVGVAGRWAVWHLADPFEGGSLEVNRRSEERQFEDDSRWSKDEERGEVGSA